MKKLLKKNINFKDIIIAIICLILCIILEIFVVEFSLNNKVDDTNIDAKLNTNNDTSNDIESYDNSQKNSDDEDIDGSNQENNNNEIVNIDYDALKVELIDMVNNDTNTNVYMETCEDTGIKDNGSPIFGEQIKTLSTNSISIFIDKLKEAVKVVKVPTEMMCPSYTYSITTNINDDSKRDSIVTAFYANNESILLVGIKDEGYAYYFKTEEDLNGFLENLE